jgi:predicted ester cyclase
MSPSANSAALRRYLEEVDPVGDLAALPDYAQPDVVLPADTTPNGRQGIEGLREHWEWLHKRVQYTSKVQDMVAEGDKVAARVTVRGRLVDEFMGLPASDKEFEVDEFMIVRFRDARMSHVTRVVDLAGLLQQLQGADS